MFGTDGSNNGERSAWLECALGVSLLMFGALLERCCALLPEPAHSQHHADALLLLPAIKVCYIQKSYFAAEVMVFRNSGLSLLMFGALLER